MLRLENISLAYGQTQVLKDVSFVLNTGEIGCVLGPSGCGKTTLLQSIAGFNKQQSGEIYVNEVCISNEQIHKRPDEREIGMVFQDFALFPHMTVLDNVGYGLHLLPKMQRLDVAQDIIEKVGMSEYVNAFPHQLSGGQQQRVAIARAVAPKPRLLLLDEPFSSLDPALREKVAVELRDIIKRLGISALLVTHDQDEAFAFADKIGVFAQGYCQQWASPHELYHQPNSAFVANFIGESTFIDATVVKNEKALSDLELSDAAVSDVDVSKSTSATSSIIDDATQLYVKSQLGLHALPEQKTNEELIRVNAQDRIVRPIEGDTVQLLIRPDDILHQDDSPLKATVIDRRFRGAHILYRLVLPELNSQGQKEQVLCLAPSHHDHQIGETFGIVLSIEDVICFSC